MKKIIRSMYNLLLTIILCVSMVFPVYAMDNQTSLTVKEKSLINKTGKLPGMILTYKKNIALNDTYEIIEEAYETPHKQLTPKATHTKSSTRTYTIRNSKQDTIAVKFTLYGKFEYNGTTGYCIDAYVDVQNNEPTNFNIVNQTAVESGDTAMGYCYALYKSTGKQYGRTLKIRITPLGEISYPN